MVGLLIVKVHDAFISVEIIHNNDSRLFVGKHFHVRDTFHKFHRYFTLWQVWITRLWSTVYNFNKNNICYFIQMFQKTSCLYLFPNKAFSWKKNASMTFAWHASHKGDDRNRPFRCTFQHFVDMILRNKSCSVSCSAKQKLSNYEPDQLVIPFHFHGDGVQLNNALGAHLASGEQQMNYFIFPTIPNEY